MYNTFSCMYMNVIMNTHNLEAYLTGPKITAFGFN